MALVDLHDEVIAICEKLDLDPNNVRSIKVEPRSAEVVVYLLGEEGNKCVDPERGGPLLQLLCWSVHT